MKEYDDDDDESEENEEKEKKEKEKEVKEKFIKKEKQENKEKEIKKIKEVKKESELKKEKNLSEKREEEEINRNLFYNKEKLKQNEYYSDPQRMNKFLSQRHLYDHKREKKEPLINITNKNLQKE